jgi:carboxyl-terminal processing protease
MLRLARCLRRCAPVLALALLPYPPVSAQKAEKDPHAISRFDRERAKVMLDDIHEALKEDYYDPTFHGVDMDARYHQYRKRLDTVPTLPEAFRVIAAYLDALHDSHVYFVPPPINYIPFYGLHMEMVAGHCLITRVRPGSDAATKLNPGDEVTGLNGWSVNPGDFDALRYYINMLAPQGGLRLDLLDPEGVKRQVLVKTHFAYTDKIQYTLNDPLDNRQQTAVAGDVFLWRFPEFDDDQRDSNRNFKLAASHPAVVLDLRGNPGGAEDSLLHMLSLFVHRKTEVADLVERTKHHTLNVDADDHHYTGKLFVLLDSDSASAAEMFARVLQLNHWAVIVGQRSAGKVMRAEERGFSVGTALQAVFGASITVNDAIMSDGHSLEGRGVIPDVPVAPTAADLAAHRDPVLAMAVRLAGGQLDGAAAGSLFPFHWPSYKTLR